MIFSRVARGNAEKIIQAGKAYKEQVIVTAEGNAQRFLSIYNAYKTDKDVIKRRIYLDNNGRGFFPD